MSKYNEQHATTMLNALQGTDTLERYKQEIKAEAIDECVEILRESFPITDNEDILYGFSCAIYRMEQLKEQR